MSTSLQYTEPVYYGAMLFIILIGLVGTYWKNQIAHQTFMKRDDFQKESVKREDSQKEFNEKLYAKFDAILERLQCVELSKVSIETFHNVESNVIKIISDMEYLQGQTEKNYNLLEKISERI
jgi:hypothetical protein